MTPEALHIQGTNGHSYYKNKVDGMHFDANLQFGLAGTTKIEFQYFETGMIWCIFQSHNKISMIEFEHSSVSVINRYKDLNENEAISHERPWGMLHEAVHCEQN